MHTLLTARHKMYFIIGCLLLLSPFGFSGAEPSLIKKSNLVVSLEQTPQEYIAAIHLHQPLSRSEVDGLMKLVQQYGMQPDIPESELTKQLSWEIGPNLEPLVRVLEVTHDRALLAYLTRMADYLMAELNDPETGAVDFLTGARAPVWYWMLPAPQVGEELNDIRASKVRGNLDRYTPESRSKVYWADPLCTGAGYMFTGRLALYILNTPSIHHLPVPTSANYSKEQGSTYLEKATHWLQLGHKTYSYFLETIWFDADRLLWHQKKDPALDTYSTELQGSVLAYNRYLKYNMGYEYVARGLRTLDPEKYGPWADRAQQIIQAGITFWKENLTVKTDERGPYYLWAYREQGRMEDTGHLIFDLNAIAAFKKSGTYSLTDGDMTAMGNTLIHYCYNNQREKLNKLMDGSGPSKASGSSYCIPGMLVIAPWERNVYDFYADKSLKVILRYAESNKFESRVIPLTAKVLAAKAALYGVADW